MRFKHIWVELLVLAVVVVLGVGLFAGCNGADGDWSFSFRRSVGQPQSTNTNDAGDEGSDDLEDAGADEED